jgi:ubiquinone/menaquinone biosynthesis C-methylase UbiE
VNREYWEERYGTEELIWKAEPNRFLVEELEAVPPGRALDVACGEGRNAVWLALKGWRVTGADFSRSALAKAQRLATDRGVEVTWVEADVVE